MTRKARGRQARALTADERRRLARAPFAVVRVIPPRTWAGSISRRHGVDDPPAANWLRDHVRRRRSALADR